MASALVYLVLCLTFDSELQKYCEKLGFILKASRGRKFYMFFFSLCCFTLIVCFYYSLAGSWTMPQDWIVNANFSEQDCDEAFNL